jgi:hypothetical protein
MEPRTRSPGEPVGHALDCGGRKSAADGAGACIPLIGSVRRSVRRSPCVFVESRRQTAARSVAARVVISPIRFSSSETESARFSLTH